MINAIKRLQIRIRGQVQGVGFRPAVYAVAYKLELTGWICNDGQGVIIEAQGNEPGKMVAELLDNLPPLADITDLQQAFIPITHSENSFVIIPSQESKVTVSATPDAHVCQACLEELFSPNNPYYLYPFVNCTHCGPRYSIIKQLPYDRNNTSMKHFHMCGNCKKQYNDPISRRHHAQPSACLECGPQYSHSIDFMVNSLQKGEILAVKGLGGYQFICLAKNEKALQTLRERKRRGEKPFALMALNEISIKPYVEINEKEIQLLKSHQRPIVLLQQSGNKLPSYIAPNLNTLGVMLPYTPLHYLLLHGLLNRPQGTTWLQEEAPLLIITSANPAGKPMIIQDEQAVRHLSPIADHIISHNRPINTFLDDSVVRVMQDQAIFIRRARGYTPKPIKLAHSMPDTLALGSHLKNTFCLIRGDEAYLSQHIGDLESLDNLQALTQQITHLTGLLEITPICVAHDKHPDFQTTQIAQGMHASPYGVQHHHAHLAAVAAEHHIDSAIGLALDGYGYGHEGDAWGGELCLLQSSSMKHLAQLRPLPLPGGDKASRQTWRMGIAVLHALHLTDMIQERYSNFPSQAILEMLYKGINSPLTSSCGRLFDAASSLLKVCQETTYEGQAAMELEALVKTPRVFEHGWKITNNQLNFLPLMTELLTCESQVGAEYFHGTLAAGLSDWIHQYARTQGINKIILSGGCFANRVLTETLLGHLSDLNVYLPHQSPINDGGISLGQAYIAALKYQIQTIGATPTCA